MVLELDRTGQEPQKLRTEYKENVEPRTVPSSSVRFRFRYENFRDGSWMIREVPIFLNKWSPSASPLKEELPHVLDYVKFLDVPMVTYISNGLSLIASKIGIMRNTVTGGAKGQKPSNSGSIMVTNSPTPNEAGIDDVMKDVPTSYANKLRPMPDDVDSVLRDGSWMIRRVPIFLNKWSPSVSLLKEELSRVSVWLKFHDVPFVAYTSDGLSLDASEIGTPMMLDAFTNTIDNLVMAIPNLEGPGYTKETIRVEYEWKPPHPVSMKQKPIYHHKPTVEASLKTAPPANMKKVLIQGNSTKKTVQTHASTSVVRGEMCALDDESKPVKKIDYTSDHDSDDEVASVDDMARFLASNPSGAGRLGHKISD
uniref:DUF4283 domain-containing protein n=1 Tax=Tanacetum cinerariifolium TaxID=118510 RepID=A0A6L2LEE4_TANCI|nr:hypothetical protein [Tanacetum cinerariifolium]